MARYYNKADFQAQREEEKSSAYMTSLLAAGGALGLIASPLFSGLNPLMLFGLGALPALAFARTA